MDEMDDIFGNNPIISSIYAVSVGVEKGPAPAPMGRKKTISDPGPAEKENDRRRRRKGTDTLLSLKKDYAKKVEMNEKKNEMLKNYLDKESAREKNQNEIKDLLKTIISNTTK